MTVRVYEYGPQADQKDPLGDLKASYARAYASALDVAKAFADLGVGDALLRWASTARAIQIENALDRYQQHAGRRPLTGEDRAEHWRRMCDPNNPAGPVHAH